MRRNIIIILVSILILTGLLVFARTTTTDLGLVKPTWDEEEDILEDFNANVDILEAFANDPLEFDTGERLEDRVGAMFSENTETFLTLTYQDSDNTIDAVVPVKDEDAMTSNSASYLCTQQSIKAYADTLHALQYLKTEIDSLSKVEAIYDKDIVDTTEINTFAKLQALVANKTLVNEEDVFTIDANWVNTANPWADNEVSDTLTASNLVAGSSVVSDSEVDNDITINLATLATTFTCTDNENEDLACPIVFVDGATGAQGAETDGDATYNPSTGTISAPIVSASSYFAGEIRLVTSDADPDTTAEIKHDSTITDIMAGGALRWFDDDSSRMLVDLETDPADDDYVVAYDAAADGFYMKADADSGGATAWDDITNPDANDEIDFGAYVIELNVADFRIGDGGSNYVKIADNGVMTFEGNASITITDLLAELDAGAHSIGFTLQTDTGTGAKTIDWKLGNKMKFTFGAGNVTFTFTAPTNPCTLMLTLIQDGTGARTVTWPDTVKWAGGAAPTLTTTANARDKVALDWDGSQYDGVCSKDFK